MSPIPESLSEETERPIPSPDDEEAWEDYMDYCAAAEALEDALKNPGGIKTMKEFAEEMGLDY